MTGRRSRRAFVAAAGAILLLLVVALSIGASPTTGSGPSPGVPGLHPSNVGSSPVHPAPFTWTNGRVTLLLAGASPTFFVSAATANSSSISVSVLGIAEVAPNGSAVALGLLPQGSSSWNLSWSATASGVQVNLTASVSVGSAQGAWNSSELPEVGEGPLGSAAVTVAFHLVNGSASASLWTVTFDLGVTGWPWVSTADALGLVLSVQTVGASTLAGGSDDVEEIANTTGSPVASLAWASNATATFPTVAGVPATVSSGTSFSTDKQATVVRLLFGGVPGGYTSLFYDPNITLVPPGTTVESAGDAFFDWAGTGGGLVGVGGGIAVVGGFAGAAIRRRRRPAGPAEGRGMEREQI